jgi:hypothetical protein
LDFGDLEPPAGGPYEWNMRRWAADWKGRKQIERKKILISLKIFD